MKRLSRLAALGLCTAPLVAAAAPVTYDLQVTATSGVLAGVVSNGSFTFDSSIVPPGGGMVTGPALLLTALDLNWNGVAWDETTANTFGFNGLLEFDPAGALTSLIVGSACASGGGVVCAEVNTNSWFISGASGNLFGFAYATAGSPGFGSGSVSFSLRTNTVAEPSTALLAALAVAAAWRLRRRTA
jgi:MYXO-CTERM domain-containing protein